MRIIAGQYRARSLLSPKTDKTRPTLDQVRESLFNIIRTEITQDTTVLDLFGGTGALALEALSRGASRAVINDMGREAYAAICANIAALHAPAEPLRLPWQEALKTAHGPFSLVFLDPPYHLTQYGDMLAALSQNERLYDDALIVIERDRRSTLTIPSAFALTDERVYRDTVLSFLRYNRQGATT